MIYENWIQDHVPEIKFRGYQGSACCPIHKEKRPSFSINGETGLWTCFSSCGHGNIITLARLLGIQPPSQPNAAVAQPRDTGTVAKKSADSSPARVGEGGPPLKIVAEYVYLDEKEIPLYKVLRTEPKGFFQKRWNGVAWVGGPMGDVRRVPFHLPQMMKADKAEIVYLVEGEKDVLKLEGVGLVATTTAMGAGSWSSHYVQFFRERTVVIFPDNDTQGEAYATRAGSDLESSGCTVKLVRLPGLPPKGDVSDYLDIPGNNRQTLLDCVRDAQAHRPLHAHAENALDYFARQGIKIEKGDDLLPGEWRSLCKKSFLDISGHLKTTDQVFELVREAELIWNTCSGKKEYLQFLSTMQKAHAL